MGENDYGLVLATVDGMETQLYRGLKCLLLLQGSLSLSINATTFAMEEDDLAVVNRNQFFTLQSGGDNLVLILSVGEGLLEQECGPLAKKYLCCNGTDPGTKDHGAYFEMKRVMTSMYSVQLNKPFGDGLSLKMHLLRFLHLLYTNFTTPEKTAIDYSAPPADKLTKQAVLEYIHQNCRRPISLKETAEHFFLTPTYFSKKFKTQVGIGFQQCLQQVRLEQSLQQLLLTRDPIVQIAIENGFPNAKAYSDVFLRYYGELPSAYRKQHHAGDTAARTRDGGLRVLLGNQPEEARQLAFLRYVNRQAATPDGARQLAAEESHTVDTGQAPIRHLRKMENLLLLDEPGMILRKDFEYCLECKDHTGARYVYFQPLDYRQSQGGLTAFTVSQLIESVKIILHYGLFPFFRLDFCRTPFTGDDAEIVEYLKGRLFPLLAVLAQNFDESGTENWRFEIVCDCFSPRQACLFYSEVWKHLKSLFLDVPIGLYATPDEDGIIGNAFSSMLEYAKRHGMAPAFITFHGFQNRVKHQNPSDIQFFKGCANFHADIAASVLVALHRHKINAKLYMTAWNTLSGETDTEKSVYVRIALIMETLMDVYNTVDGVGYRYAKRDRCPYSGEVYGAPLDLFIFNNTKRPVYHVANIANRISGALLYQSDHVAVSRGYKGELIVAVWNSQYLNPASSMDPFLADSLARMIRVELQGLENRFYSISRLTVDINSSGSLSRIKRSGFPNWSDKDVYEYLHDAEGGDFYYYTQEAKNGAISLHSTMHYNGIVMYTLK